MSRKYELKRRAERQADTRRRIVEATVALHTSVGPARTTISAIAERAGVERHTVYAHFPDEHRLHAACSAHWRELHPFPDTDAWTAADPADRLRRALDDVYGWYEEVGDRHRDLQPRRGHPRDHGGGGGRREGVVRGAQDKLADGWPRRKAVRAAIGHAFDFETWRSLTRRQGLTRKQAVDAMLTFVAGV